MNIYFCSFQADGTLLTILTDFRTNAQILRLIIPGEEELNEPRAQTICFISSFNNDLISPEAVMKLRQKHPGTVRIADDDMGEIVQDSPLKVGPRASALWISSHLPKMCREAFSSEVCYFLNSSKVLKFAVSKQERVKSYP